MWRLQQSFRKVVTGYEDVHGGNGYGLRNTEGKRILEFAVAHDLVVGNTHIFTRKIII